MPTTAQDRGSHLCVAAGSLALSRHTIPCGCERAHAHTCAHTHASHAHLALRLLCSLLCRLVCRALRVDLGLVLAEGCVRALGAAAARRCSDCTGHACLTCAGSSTPCPCPPAWPPHAHTHPRLPPPAAPPAGAPPPGTRAACRWRPWSPRSCPWRARATLPPWPPAQRLRLLPSFE
jgi:hypothetical protein